MDPFELLPPELIVQILLSTADFVGIESLLIVSPRVYAVFYERPSRSFQAILEANSIASEDVVQRTIREVWLLHGPSFDEYLKFTDGVHGQLETDTHTYTHDATVPKMMQISAQIQRLACLCLSTMRQNFVNAIGCTGVGSLPGPVRAQYAARDFSWVEEANVFWILWHLRHYSDLHTRGSHENWPASSAERFAEYRERNSLHMYHAEMISVVSAILDDLGLNPIYSYPGLRECEESPEASWGYPVQTPLPRFHSFELEDTHITIWPPQPKPEVSPVTIAWCLGPDFCGRFFNYMQMYRMWTIMRSRSISNPDVHVQRMQLYRRLGIFIWDIWRMFSTGLISWKKQECIETPDGHFTEIHDIYTQELQSRWLALVQH